MTKSIENASFEHMVSEIEKNASDFIDLLEQSTQHINIITLLENQWNLPS